ANREIDRSNDVPSAIVDQNRPFDNLVAQTPERHASHRREIVRAVGRLDASFPRELNGFSRRAALDAREPVAAPALRGERRRTASGRPQRCSATEDAHPKGQHARASEHVPHRKTTKQIVAAEIGGSTFIAKRAQAERSRARGKCQGFERERVGRPRLHIRADENCRALLDDIGTSPLRDAGNRDPFEVVFGGGHVPNAAVERGATGVYARENPLESSKTGRRESRPRDESLDARGKLIAAWLAFELHG